MTQNTKISDINIQISDEDKSYKLTNWGTFLCFISFANIENMYIPQIINFLISINTIHEKTLTGDDHYCFEMQIKKKPINPRIQSKFLYSN